MTTPCPQCGKEYRWSTCLDVYPDAVEVNDWDGKDRSVWSYLCVKCKGTIGVVVLDSAGLTLYTQDKTEL